MLIRRILAILGLILFLTVMVLIPVWLYADTLWRDAFGPDAEMVQTQSDYVTKFDLDAQEGMNQMASRVNGWLSAVESREVSVRAPRGMLHAVCYEPVGGAADAPWAIVFHGGVGTTRKQVEDVACMLSLEGYRVLTPDLYAHGASEGAASTLGFGDAQDVGAWVSFVLAEQPDARMVLFGQGEGAAAVLCAAGNGLPENVTAVAADSACNGVAQSACAQGAQDDSGLSGMLLHAMLRHQAGSEPIAERIAGDDTPLLLIHGTGDQQVPAWNSEDIALAAGDRAKLLLIEGAGHGLSRYLEPDTYYDALLAFYCEHL